MPLSALPVLTNEKPKGGVKLGQKKYGANMEAKYGGKYGRKPPSAWNPRGGFLPYLPPYFFSPYLGETDRNMEANMEGNMEVSLISRLGHFPFSRLAVTGLLFFYGKNMYKSSPLAKMHLWLRETRILHHFCFCASKSLTNVKKIIASICPCQLAACLHTCRRPFF